MHLAKITDSRNGTEMPPRKGFAVAETLADRAYIAIEEMIMTAALPPGTFVSESQLSTELEIGRTPVREALKRLEADGLVAVVASRGILVTEVNLADQLLMLEVRRELERLLARRAARFASAAERQRFTELVALMRDAADSGEAEQFMRHDQEFNTLLSAAARNPMLTRSIRPLRSMSRRFWFQHSSQQNDSLRRGALTHTSVMEAIAAGDAALAATQMDLLMDYVEEFARSTIERFA
jgi:DNA-binding GntR family transcriptional regulator